jgi:carboxypeptidase PM20D1
MLYEIEGKDKSLRPYLLTAHFDVVPASPAGSSDSEWTHGPFSGHLSSDGQIYGRGAMDDKSSMLAQLEAVQIYLRKHKQPSRALYLAYGHDEELSGHQGAKFIAKHLESLSVKLEYVIDEGTMIIEHFISDLAKPIALIGVADKGYLTVKFFANTTGGHSSMPNRDNSAFSILSEAANR